MELSYERPISVENNSLLTNSKIVREVLDCLASDK